MAIATTARATWSGSVTFGMVSFPVRLYGAARDKDLRFNQVHKACGQRVNAPTVCRTCNVEVTRDELVKGYAVSKDQLVLLEENDFEALPLASVQAVEVIAAVDEAELPFVMADKTYWVGPDDRARVGHKAFVLFRDALARKGQVAVGRIAMRAGKENLCVVRPYGKALALTLLHWGDELVDSGAVEESVAEVAVSEAEAALADKLLDSLRSEPDVLFEQRDAYREALETLIEAKLSGQEPVRLPAVKPAESVDLLAALEASLAAAKEKVA